MRRIVFPQVGAEPEGAPPSLTRFAWLSIAAAVLTIGLKSGAYLLTGSVGLLSDAAESGVNLVAAVVALVALHVAARAPDRKSTRRNSSHANISDAVFCLKKQEGYAERHGEAVGEKGARRRARRGQVR